MSAYTKAIKAASAKYEALLTRYRARFGDATMSSKEQRMLEQELSDAQRTVQRLMKQAEAEDVYGWGPDQQLDEMMQRYRQPEQMGLDLQGGAQSEIPWNQIEEDLYLTDPSTWRRGLESDRAVPGPDPRQRDMFEPGITINKSRKGFPIEDDVWGHSRLTRDEMEGRYMILRKQSDELEASYQAGDIPRLKNSPHGESYEDSRARLNSALEDIEHRMQYNWD